MHKNIGLYFGSFNPIHIGHLIIAQQMLNRTAIDAIWFIVSPHNPFKDPKNLLPESDRLDLVQCAIAENPKFKTSDIEFSLPKPSYTYLTLQHLSLRYPDLIFSLLMGSDILISIPNWKNGRTILENYPLYIYERPGYPLPDKPAKNIHILENIPLLTISASFIRTQIEMGNPLTYLVPEAVEKAILRKKYYRKSYQI